MDQKEFHPNEYVSKSLYGYKNDTDPQVDAAIEYLSNLDKKRVVK